MTTNDATGDLALAAAAAAGERRALARLDELARETARRAVARIDPSPAFAGLVAQELMTKLIVGERPRIREYSGRGPLASWLLIAARRIALNLRRGAGDRGRAELPADLVVLEDGAEMLQLRARYRGEFEHALRAALALLPTSDRAMLLLHVRDGMSGAQLAGIYGVSAATAKRMLTQSRELLRSETQRQLCLRLRLTSSEFRSMARIVCRDLDVSLVRLLARRAEAV